jgi:hypothetical protein
VANISCFNNYLSDKRIFFEAQPDGGVDLFAIYCAQPKDPEIFKAIRAYNTLRSIHEREYAKFTKLIDKSAKTIAKSGCITHGHERTWVIKPPK